MKWITLKLLVDGLKHNLLNINQLCDKGYIIPGSKNKIKNKTKVILGG
jgi:hypothetical protein